MTEQERSARRRQGIARDILVQAAGTLLAGSIAWMFGIALGYFRRPEGIRLLMSALMVTPLLAIPVSALLSSSSRVSHKTRGCANIIFVIASILVFGVIGYAVYFGK